MPDPYFSSRELHFLNSLGFPETGFLLHINCGAGEGLAQFHELRPRLDLQGIEPSGALRAAFGRSSHLNFSACVWGQDFEKEAEAASFDVLYVSGIEAAEVREPQLLRKHFDRYWNLLADGGFLLIEVSFAHDRGESSLDGETNGMPWLAKNVVEIGERGMRVGWLPAPFKERGILALRKRGGR